MAVTFFNVGQGDCTLVQLDNFAALFDGGRKSKLSQNYVDAIRRRAPILDLVVGTHYDADHLGGLVKVIHAYRDRIWLALVPPVIDDLRPGIQRVRHTRLRGTVAGLETTVNEEDADPAFLAHQLTEGLEPALIEYDRALEPLIEVLDSLAGQFADGLPPGEWESAALSNLPENEPLELPFAEDGPEDSGRFGELTEAPPLLERDLDVFRVAALRRARQKLASARRLPRAHRLIELALVLVGGANPGGDVWAPRRWDLGLPASRPAVQRIVRIIKQEGNRTITACWLHDLIEALQSHGIHWEVTLAPSSCTWIKRPIEICQLEPTAQILKRHEHRIPVAVHFQRLSALQPTPANQLSYVFALRGISDRHEPTRPGVLITGDSGFRDTPSNCDAVLAACSLVHVPHHGGRWGDFHTRLIGAHKGRSGPLRLWTTVNPQGCSPPTQPQRDLRAALRACSGFPYGAGLDVVSYFNNTPNPTCVGCSRALPRSANGPPWVRFVERNGGWEPDRWAPKRCTCR